MADVIDDANALVGEHLARSIAAARALADATPAGAAGECEECGEQRPRLIEGCCLFCRDGRRP